MNHDAITKVMTSQGPYGTGVWPNPYADTQTEWRRRADFAGAILDIDKKIRSITEPRFITPPETSELIAALVTATDSRKILELGTCTGYTTLHILKAIFGKPDAFIVSVDARPAHDRKFWLDPRWSSIIRFLEGWTPEVLSQLHGTEFDLVFIDSDHSVEHTKKELEALWPITRKGTIFLVHDLPEWQTPSHHAPPPVRNYLLDLVKEGILLGLAIPTCEQADCLDTWGPGYPKQCNPGLGIFIRNQ